VPFFSFQGDCGPRGLYDSPQSALRPAWSVAQCVSPVYVIVCEWMACNAALNPGQVCILFVRSVQQCRQFYWLLGLYALHQMGTPCEPSSALPYQPGHNVVSAVLTLMYAVVHSHLLTANMHYNSSPLIPEFNGLSQFVADTGELCTSPRI